MDELRRLQIPSDGPSPVVNVLEEASQPEGRRQRISFESEPGVRIEGRCRFRLLPGKSSSVARGG